MGMVNTNPELSQGIETFMELYNVKWDAEGYYKLYCGDEFVGSGRDLYNKHVPANLILLNDAYKRGYHRCSVELMNAKVV